MKRLIQSVLKPFRLRLAKLNSAERPAFGANIQFAALKRFSFRPMHIIDVGANHGNWPRKVIEYFPDAAYTHGVPLDILKRHVRDLADRVFKKPTDQCWRGRHSAKTSVHDFPSRRRQHVYAGR